MIQPLFHGDTKRFHFCFSHDSKIGNFLEFFKKHIVQFKPEIFDMVSVIAIALGWVVYPSPATQSPDFPPCFSSTFTSVIVIPRSTALHMSYTVSSAT